MKTRIYLSAIALIAAAIATILIAHAQEKPKKDSRAGSMSTMSEMSTEEMNKRGDHVMGFDHMKTTHHFRLLSNGGEIEITSNSAEDVESRDQIRMHLGHIAEMFAEGNFNAPMMIHEQT